MTRLALIPLTITLLAGSSMGAAATVLEVPAQYATIQAAIDAAQNGDEIRIDDGTYSGPGDTDLDLQGKSLSLTSVHGSAYTIVDGNGSAAGLRMTSGETGVRVAGITFRECVDPALDPGGAVRMVGSEADFEDCNFTANHGTGALGVVDGTVGLTGCSFTDNTSAEGAAVYLENAELTGRSCIFNTNTAERGGSILARSSHLDLEASNFFQSVATVDHGGGIYLEGVTGFARLSRLVCLANEAAGDGGVIYAHLADLHVDGGLFDINQAGRGGAIGMSGSDGRVVDCDFINQTAEEGGAIWIEGGRCELWTSRMGNNHATLAGGGVAAGEGSFLHAVGCQLSGDQSDGIGGGLALEPTAVLSTSYTYITGNRSGGDGAGLHARGTADPYAPTFLDLHSTVIASNQTLMGSGGGFAAVGQVEGGLDQSVVWRNCGVAPGDQILIEGEATVSATCSSLDSTGVLLLDGGSFSADAGTSFADPRFCAPLSCFSAPSSNGDFRFEPGSECLPSNGPCDLLIGVSSAACGVLEPTGSCCTDDGFCFLAQDYVCGAVEAAFGGDGTTCDPSPCSASSAPVVASVTPPLELQVESPVASPAVIRLAAARPGRLTVDVFDADGRHVRRLADRTASRQTELDWDLRSQEGQVVAAGVYFVRAAVSGLGTATERLVVLR